MRIQMLILGFELLILVIPTRCVECMDRSKNEGMEDEK